MCSVLGPELTSERMVSISYTVKECLFLHSYRGSLFFSCLPIKLTLLFLYIAASSFFQVMSRWSVGCAKGAFVLILIP